MAIQLELTDQELLVKFKESNDSLWLGHLFKRYAHLVYAVCLKYLRDREDSKDASMQIFEKLFEDLKKHEIQYFKSWLYQVAKNYCLMQLRKKKANVNIEEVKEISLGIMEFSFDLHPEDKENQLYLLEQGLHTLKEEQKLCIDLFFLQEKSYKEIIELTGYSFKEIKSHIQNGKRNLQNYLKDNHEKKAR